MRTDLPVEEIKSGVKLIAACLRAKADVTIGVVKSTISTKPKSSGGKHSNQERQAERIKDVPGKPSEAIELFEKLLSYNNNLQSRIRVVARVRRGWSIGMVKVTGDWSEEQVALFSMEPTK